MPTLGFLAFSYAWYNILLFIKLDFVDTNLNLTDYLKESNVFLHAYQAVTGSIWQWYWSWQILGWTVSVVLRIWEEGFNGIDNAHDIKVTEKWALLWTGFFGAMSTCGGFLFGRITEKGKFLFLLS
jgi:hypothetical protein